MKTVTFIAFMIFTSALTVSAQDLPKKPEVVAPSEATALPEVRPVPEKSVETKVAIQKKADARAAERKKIKAKKTDAPVRGTEKK